MTTTVNPGPWYIRLSTYKTFDYAKGDLLAAVAELFLDANEAKITAQLGGPATLTTIVPSTSGFTYAQQPLRRTLARAPQLDMRLSQCLEHVEGQRTSRRSYTPEAFRALPGVDGQRVILIEDTWVTGGTAISAAGALLEAGAIAVAVIPIARIVEKNSYLSPKYLEYMDDAPWEATDWARD